MRAKGGLPEECGHELVRVDLVDLALHGTSPLLAGKAIFLLLELSHGLRLFLLSCPLQFDFAVQLAMWLQIDL